MRPSGVFHQSAPPACATGCTLTRTHSAPTRTHRNPGFLEGLYSCIKSVLDKLADQGVKATEKTRQFAFCLDRNKFRARLCQMIPLVRRRWGPQKLTCFLGSMEIF